MKTCATPGTMLNFRTRSMLVYENGTGERSCENCEFFEEGGYCLLHSRQIKNADIVTCRDFNEKNNERINTTTDTENTKAASTLTEAAGSTTTEDIQNGLKHMADDHPCCAQSCLDAVYRLDYYKETLAQLKEDISSNAEHTHDYEK